jgi:septal ring factor EnvC (AmiA/AmiB activator)
MNIKFKDTLIKENLLAWLMVLCALTSGVVGLFCPPINWTGVVWAFAAAITALDIVIVDTIRLNEKRELKQDLKHKSEYIAELEARVDDLRKQRSDYAAKHEDVLGQLQALDNEYLKLAKQHNAQGEELSKLKKEYDSLVQSLPFEAPVPTTPPKPKKNPTTATSKKAKYTKKDIARIQEEMKAGGMIKEKDEE